MTTTPEDTNIYERIKLAADCLADPSWLGIRFEGDEGAAREFLQNKYFRALAGWVSIDKLLKIYEAIPYEVWKTYHFDLKAVESIYDDEQRGRRVLDDEPKEKRTNWKKLYQEAQEELEQLRRENAALRSSKGVRG